ncbi:hypothetical protein SLS57_006931 [Botryosphaeria dothidea]
MPVLNGSRFAQPPLILFQTRTQQLHIIRRTIDGNGFNWLVWAVAASGFFTDSYNLFTTNVIIQALYFVYWPTEHTTEKEFYINLVTLLGSMVGQLLFGVLADKFGRTRLYGVELVIVIFSTLGVASASEGVNSMNFLAWLLVWRFMMGVGIGAEYPLSAVITTEYVPVRMPPSAGSPLGQLIANLVGLVVVIGYNNAYDIDHCSHPDTDACAQHVDGVWRWVTGVGAMPALLAIVFRFLIKDPGLYELEVRNDGDSAIKNTDQVYGSIMPENSIPLRDRRRGNGHMTDMGEPPLPVQFSRQDLYSYFIEQGNIWYLVGTSLTWWLLDFAFYGLGMGNPRTLAKLWIKNSERVNRVVEYNNTVPTWNVLAPATIYPDNGGNTIYATLVEATKRSMITVSIGSILGSLVFILAGDYMPRRQALTFSFVILGTLFAVTGGVIFGTNDSGFHSISIVLVGLIYFIFNLGANTLTFIIPAEIFPTRYRCTCHGIAAASGKLGSVLVQWILRRAYFHGWKADSLNNENLGYVFVVFACVMLTGALFSWAWIPEVQNRRDERNGLRLPSKTLEELGKGMEGARAAKGEDESVSTGEGGPGIRRRGWVRWLRRV